MRKLGTGEREELTGRGFCRAGLVWARSRRPRVVFTVTLVRGRNVAIDLIADPERLPELRCRASRAALVIGDDYAYLFARSARPVK